jgi:hypothetical protein
MFFGRLPGPPLLFTHGRARHSPPSAVKLRRAVIRLYQIFCFTWLFSLAISISSAAEPTLDYIFPVTWPQGDTVAISLGGKLDPWPVTVWTDCPGLNFSAQTNNDNSSTNIGKFSVQIAKNAPLGPHVLRVFNADGASVPRLFLIAEQKDPEEIEPNDSVKQAQPIGKLPATILGRLEKGGDVDSFSMHVEAGKWLVARLEAYWLGSPLDGLLNLVDEQSLRVAFNHDSAKNIDPLLAYQVGRTGTYILQVAGFAHPPEANVKFAGTLAAVYRLTVTDGPIAHHIYPTGVQRGHKAQVQLFGWNLAQSGHSNKWFDASNLNAAANKEWLSVAGVQGQFSVLVSDAPEQIEIESNNKINQAHQVALPCAISGRIDPPGDEDRFIFAAKKDERWDFRVISGALDLPLDAVLKIEDATGKVLAEDDDGHGRPDAKLVWAAPSDGLYIAAVSDRFGNGGNDFVYRLAIASPIPDFKVVIPDNVIRLEPGKTNELKLTVTRYDGYTKDLRVNVDGLPTGVKVEAAEVPSQNGDVKVTFLAANNAPPANQPLRILVQTTNSPPSGVRAAMFDLRGKDPRFEALLNETDQLWLTVIPKPAVTKPEETTK